MNKLILSLVILFCATIAFATQVPKGTKVYKQPTGKAPVIFILDKTYDLQLKSTKFKNWYQVTVSAKGGFVYLTLGAGGSAGPTGAATGGAGGAAGAGTGAIGGAGAGSAGGAGGAGKTVGGKQKAGQAGTKPLQRGGKTGSAVGGSAGAADSGAGGAQGSGSAQGGGQSEGEKIRAQHDAAKRAAEAANQDFCSQCWYAKRGLNPERFEDTNPKVVDGQPVEPEGAAKDTAGKKIVE